MQSIVYLIRQSEYTVDGLLSIFRELQFDSILSSANSIAIKPNLCAGDHCSVETGAVVSKDTLAVLIKAVRSLNKGSKILVCESDSIGSCQARDKFAFQGYDQLKALKNVQLLDLTKDRLKAVDFEGLHISNIFLSERLLKADVKISVSKMKTHSVTTITGALKNQFGCISDIDKSCYHPYLTEVISDINKIVKPNFFIVDGNPAMEGNGPTDGDARPMDLVIIGNDPVSVDAVMAHIMGFNPNSIPHLMHAYERDIGEIHLEHIELRGIPMDEFKTHFTFVPYRQLFMIRLGLGLQRFSKLLDKLGHKIHNLTSPLGILKLPLAYIYHQLQSSRNSFLRQIALFGYRAYKKIF